MRFMSLKLLSVVPLVLALVLGSASAMSADSSSLAGTDANANGIRDDVDAYIAAKYTQEPQRKAVSRLARILQSAILLPEGDAAAAKAVSIQMTQAISCVFTHFAIQTENPVKDMEERVVNTPERKRHYRNYNKALNGTVSSLPEKNSCE